MDSTGLHTLITVNQSAERNGFRVSLRPGAPQIQRLFELTGLLDRFRFEEAELEHLDGWPNPPPAVPTSDSAIGIFRLSVDTGVSC